MEKERGEGTLIYLRFLNDIIHLHIIGNILKSSHMKVGILISLTPKLILLQNVDQHRFFLKFVCNDVLENNSRLIKVYHWLEVIYDRHQTVVIVSYFFHLFQFFYPCFY